MWRRKKLILFVLLGIMLLSGIAGGIAAAQSGDESSGQTQDQAGALLDKVSQIYQQNTGVAIDAQQLKDAFAQAQKEMEDEALQSWLQNLVSEGKITQEQADQYLQWWQSRPDDIPLLEPRGGGGMMWGRGHGCWGGPFTPLENSDTSGS
jgi:hypothetical protein